MTGDFSVATTTSGRDWARWVRRNVELRQGGAALASTTTIRADSLDLRGVDVAADLEGTLYVLRERGSLYRYDPRTGMEQRVWDRTESDVVTPAAVCATGDRAFVADGSDGTVAVVSTRLQRTIGTVETGAEAPIALDCGDGVVYVLDADGEVYSLGEGDAAPTERACRRPVDLAVDDRGVPYVLEGRPDPALHVLGGSTGGTTDGAGDGATGGATDGAADDRGTARIAEFRCSEGSFDPRLLTVTAGSLLVVGEDVDGATALYEWDPSSETFTERRSLGARCSTISGRPGASPDSSLELYGVVRRFRETRQNARHPETGRHRGTTWHYYDAGERGTQWHRLEVALEGASANSQVRLHYDATDEEPFGSVDSVDGLPATAVDRLEDAAVGSGWELARADPAALADDVGCDRSTAAGWIDAAAAAIETRGRSEWTTVDSFDPGDVLLEGATGRYLRVGIELVGGPERSPRVDEVRALCPRQSYLRYLPELYQSDDRSAAFLERFLSVFETTFVGVEEELEHFCRYLDPDAVPGEYLDWLEGWLAADPSPEWPDGARREFLDRAPELYRRRGTLPGLRATIELYLRHATAGTDGRRTAVDPLGETAAEAADGDEPAEAPGDLPSGHRLFFLEHGDVDAVDRRAARRAFRSAVPGPHSVAVFCGPFERSGRAEAVERIVERTVPAHVASEVTQLDRDCTLDGGTFLGINSELATREFALGSATLGDDAVLQSRERRLG